MRRTAASRSPGARWLLAAALSVALTGAARGYETGQEAFDAGDFRAAAEIWAEASAAGEPQAAAGLAMLNDLGLGVAQDRARAFLLYLQAGEAGLPDAAFNVAVMLDSGIGTERNRPAAALWYARAALRGQTRAQYNLGLLYASGDGVPRNAAVAEHWLTQAGSSLAAARERLASLAPDDPTTLEPPVPLGAFPVDGTAELVWSQGPGPEGSVTLLQVASPGPEGLDTIRTEPAPGGAAVLDPAAEGTLWRVLQAVPSRGDYAAGPWLRPDGAVAASEPRGRVTFRLRPGDDRAARLVADYGPDLARGGVAVAVATVAEDTAETVGLRYGFGSDLGLARDVAGYLPGLAPAGIVEEPGLGTPGEVIIDLVLGPAVFAYSGR